LLVFNSIRICSAFEFLLLSRAFFVHLPPPLLSLRSTSSIPFVFCILLFSGGKHLYPPTGRLNM
jgi:hypothetical protein